MRITVAGLADRCRLLGEDSRRLLARFDAEFGQEAEFGPEQWERALELHVEPWLLLRTHSDGLAFLEFERRAAALLEGYYEKARPMIAYYEAVASNREARLAGRLGPARRALDAALDPLLADLRRGLAAAMNDAASEGQF